MTVYVELEAFIVILIYSLFIDTFNSSDCITQNDRTLVADKLERRGGNGVGPIPTFV
jgi:hypothetical protein